MARVELLLIFLFGPVLGIGPILGGPGSHPAEALSPKNVGCHGETGKPHINRSAGSASTVGGFVADTAEVADTAYVAPSARVCGHAKVTGTARIYGNAVITGNAVVSDQAHVFGRARVSGSAQVSGDARVSEQAEVMGTAVVAGSAKVRGNARITGDAKLGGEVVVLGIATVATGTLQTGEHAGPDMTALKQVLSKARSLFGKKKEIEVTKEGRRPFRITEEYSGFKVDGVEIQYKYQQTTLFFDSRHDFEIDGHKIPIGQGHTVLFVDPIAGVEEVVKLDSVPAPIHDVDIDRRIETERLGGVRPR